MKQRRSTAHCPRNIIHDNCIRSNGNFSRHEIFYHCFIHIDYQLHLVVKGSPLSVLCATTTTHQHTYLTMAHSARSKSKKVTKKVKTSNPNSDYFKAAQARTERLANKIKENLEKQNLEKASATSDDLMETEETEKRSAVVQTPVDELHKVKTHGWRKSRASDYKKKKASKKNKSMKF